MLHTNSYCYNSMYLPKVKDSEDQFELRFPVPGFDKSDIQIKVKDNYLFINGENEEDKFEKTYELSDAINKEKISAEVNKGILKLTLPKHTPEYKEITIN